MPEPQSPPATFAQALSEAQSLDASLSQRLAFYRENSARLGPDLAGAYDALVARLENLDNGHVGPGIGDPMPNFVLPDETGRLVSLSSMLESGPAVISINRGHWCPYCRLELHALTERYGDIRTAGAQLIAIMPDVAEVTRRYRSERGLPFPILSDIDLGYALHLGLVFWIGEDVKRLYDEIGVDLARCQGNASYFLPFAAKFIVGTDGIVKAREVNVEFRQRIEPSAIIDVLRKM